MFENLHKEKVKFTHFPRKTAILLKNITKKYKKLLVENGELKQKTGCFFDRSILDGISWKKYNIHNM